MRIAMKSGGVDCLLEHLSIAQGDKASLIMPITWLFKLFKEVRHLLQIKVPKASTSLSQSDRWLSEVEAFGTELVRFFPAHPQFAPYLLRTATTLRRLIYP